MNQLKKIKDVKICLHHPLQMFNVAVFMYYSVLVKKKIIVTIVIYYFVFLNWCI